MFSGRRGVPLRLKEEPPNLNDTLGFILAELTHYSWRQVLDWTQRNWKYATDPEREELKSFLGEQGQNMAADDNSVMEEINFLFALLRKMREKITNRDKQDPDYFDTKEYRDLISSSISLFSLMTKLKEQIHNQDLIKSLQKAYALAVLAMPEEQRGIYYEELGKACAEAKRNVR